MYRLTSLLIVFFFCFGIVIVHAQQCLETVESALDTMGKFCTELERNQVCYGNHAIDVQITDEFVFEDIGDVVDVTHVGALSLSAYDETTNDWGISLFSLQANIPNTVPGQNVTMIAFGNTQLWNAVEPTVEIELIASNNANIRSTPSTSRVALGSIHAGDRIIATGQFINSNGEQWIRVYYNGSFKHTGWISASLLVGDDIGMLEPVTADSINVTPMQAFTFHAGIGQSTCTEVPLDGLLIQTPDGVGTVLLTINGIQFAGDATMYLSFDEDDGNESMIVTVLDGQIAVSSDDVSQTVIAGESTIIPTQGDNADIDGGDPLPPLPSRDIFGDSGVTQRDSVVNRVLQISPDPDVSRDWDAPDRNATDDTNDADTSRPADPVEPSNTDVDPFRNDDTNPPSSRDAETHESDPTRPDDDDDDDDERGSGGGGGGGDRGDDDDRGGDGR
jgi:hypothetical protein